MKNILPFKLNMLTNTWFRYIYLTFYKLVKKNNPAIFSSFSMYGWIFRIFFFFLRKKVIYCFSFCHFTTLLLVAWTLIFLPASYDIFSVVDGVLEPLKSLKKFGKISGEMCIIVIDGLCEAEQHRYSSLHNPLPCKRTHQIHRRLCEAEQHRYSLLHNPLPCKRTHQIHRRSL